MSGFLYAGGLTAISFSMWFGLLRDDPRPSVALVALAVAAVCFFVAFCSGRSKTKPKAECTDCMCETKCSNCGGEGECSCKK
ncbi:MAG: hypothetical protein Q8R25_00820 [bacterium]|nr:hypothetical protein [bacterium]